MTGSDESAAGLRFALHALDGLYRVADAVAPVVIRAATQRLERANRLFFPDRDARWWRQTARTQARHRVCSALDKVFIPRLSKESLLSRFDPESTARLRAVIDAALAKGRGAVVCSMHIGRPIAALYMHAALGYSCYRVRNGEVPPSLVRRFAAAESPSTNVSLINARDPACLLKAVRALRHNGLLFLMIDGRVFGRSGRGSLLGREVVTSVTGVELARITGAELLAGACCSTGPFRFRTRVDPVACAPDEAASRLLQMMETVVAEEPGQWFGVCRTSRMSVARSELD